MSKTMDQQLHDLAVTQVMQVVTVTEAVEHWDLAESTIRHQINRGALVARKSGETWLIAISSLRARWGPAKKPLQVPY